MELSEYESTIISLLRETGIRYDHDDDDVGRHACCDELSYRKHCTTCKFHKAAVLLRANGVELPADIRSEYQV